MRLDMMRCKLRIRTYRNKLAKDFDDPFDFWLFVLCIAFAAGCVLLVAAYAYEGYCTAA